MGRPPMPCVALPLLRALWGEDLDWRLAFCPLPAARFPLPAGSDSDPGWVQCAGGGQVAGRGMAKRCCCEHKHACIVLKPARCPAVPHLSVSPTLPALGSTSTSPHPCPWLSRPVQVGAHAPRRRPPRGRHTRDRVFGEGASLQRQRPGRLGHLDPMGSGFLASSGRLGYLDRSDL